MKLFNVVEKNYVKFILYVEPVPTRIHQSYKKNPDPGIFYLNIKKKKNSIIFIFQKHSNLYERCRMY